MAVFPLLSDPSGYTPCAWDLADDAVRRAYWIGVFREHLASLVDIAAGQDERDGKPEARPRAVAMASEFGAYLDRCEREPGAVVPLNILEICIARERLLRLHGFADPYRDQKAAENEKAMALLPALLRELDALEDEARLVALVEGVFAGNIYDLGAVETMKMFADGDGGGGVSFEVVRGKLKPRPWHVDDFDAFASRWRERGYERAVLFVDNAGPDVLLGMMPFARELLRRGAAVVITANSEPALNDVTYEELVGLVERVREFDAVMREGDLTLVPSGNGAPLIDLARVSEELVTEVNRDKVDFVVLEGMGRGLESNYAAKLDCDCVKIAMLKDRGVAESLGGGMFDLVFRYEPARDG